MSGANGPKRAILYARVSTDEQAKSGYSLGQQISEANQKRARYQEMAAEGLIDFEELRARAGRTPPGV